MTWYGYLRTTYNSVVRETGWVEQVIRKAEDSDDYNRAYFMYDTAGRVWITLRDRWQVSEGQPVNCERLAAREYRYDSGRARYLMRDLDPVTLLPANGYAGTWTDYDGDTAYGDYTLNSDESVVTTMRYMPGQWEQGATFSAHHGDQIGTSRVMTDANAGALRRAVYTAFGELVSEDAAAATRYGYAGAWGYETDIATAAPDFNFIHVGERWYDPASGRFLQRDPIGIVADNNVFAYVLANPVDDIDPDGLNPRWREQVRRPNGTFGPKRVWYRRISPNRWVWAYGLGSAVARAGHWICGAPYEEPHNVLLDIAEQQYEAAKREAENARQRAQHPKVFPPPPIPPPTRDAPILCFSEETLVETSTGPEPIECLSVGWAVCVPASDQVARFEAVTNTFVSEASEIVEVRIAAETLVVTREHPFWVEGRGWVLACELTVGDLLKGLDDRPEPVLTVCPRQLQAPIRVYNISVNGAQTYFVGKSRLLTHNRSC